MPLRAFSATETAAYIATRLARAGMREQTAIPPDVLLDCTSGRRGFRG